jgi:hypothetical protein
VSDSSPATTCSVSSQTFSTQPDELTGAFDLGGQEIDIDLEGLQDLVEFLDRRSVAEAGFG